MKNISEFLSENVQFLVVTISIYLNRRVFVMPKEQTGNGTRGVGGGGGGGGGVGIP